MSTQKWAEDYKKYSDNPPPAGTILRCYGGVDGRLDLELVEGKPPFLYGRVYVPHVVGEPLGWFLQPFDSDAAYGWKCILLPKAREEALRRLSITEKRLRVKALKVVRYSRTGSSILCEIAEYADCEFVVAADAAAELSEVEHAEDKAQRAADKWAARGVPEVQIDGEIIAGTAPYGPGT